MKCWISSETYWVLYWKWKIGQLYGYRMVVSGSVPSIHSWPGAVAHCPNVTEGAVPCIASPGKDPDSKFKVQFLLNAYHFRTIIKSKSISGSIPSQGPSVFNTILNRVLFSVLCCICESIKFILLNCGRQAVVCPVKDEGRALFFNHDGYLVKAFQWLLMKQNDPLAFITKMFQKRDLGLMQRDAAYFDYRRYFDFGGVHWWIPGFKSTY